MWYAGLNTRWSTPDGKQVFEVQWHTADSLTTKETESHAIYQQQRLLAPSDPQWSVLQEQSDAVWSRVRSDPPVRTPAYLAYLAGLTPLAGSHGQ